MAVFINYEQWGWNSLPATYTENSYFTLDPSIIKMTVNQEENKTTVKEKSFPETSVLEQINSEYDSLDRQQLCTSQKLKNAALMCREHLSQIKDLTYLCHNYQLLEETGGLLLAIAKDFRTKLEAEDGLLLENQITQRGQCIAQPSIAANTSYSELPCRKKRKRKVKGSCKSKKKLKG